MAAPALHKFLAHLLPVAALNTLVALGITLNGSYSLGSNLVFSHCIGLAIWALVQLGCYAWVQDLERQWQRLLLLVPLAVLLGYAGGTLLASLLLGLPSAGVWGNLQVNLRYLLLSLLVGAGCSYYFVSQQLLQRAKERSAALQLHAAESRLKLLQTQLAPHMLFNTLANLQALIATDPARASQMLDHLIAYLRATLGASRNTEHSLRAEFTRLHDYLALMAVRMGPRLQYTLDLPAELAEHMVPTLLLQPLVENSVQHGLEPQVAGGQISVQARRSGGMLVLAVTDTGVGLSANADMGKGFGLAQVRERLATAYGDLGTIELIAPPAGGSCASITFPL
ncbi:Histidine kinase [Rhodoferax sp. OV413]|uniref:sensor histidine kinase n=1 Tax=Rhodoferax sp. OV413 TaxID=1855285 RepID=UPI000891DD38|nr:histidine kinase [Rhodoferax sp. OV413]SDP87319.1 Histidine kinase [Rhodoferax sp. OV413]